MTLNAVKFKLGMAVGSAIGMALYGQIANDAVIWMDVLYRSIILFAVLLIVPSRWFGVEKPSVT